MSARKLPKAIRPWTDLAHAAAAASEALAVAEPDPMEAVAETAPRGDLAAPPQAAAPLQAATPAETIAPTPASDASDPAAAKRRARARLLVERHATYSAVGGLIPLPIANVAGVTAIIVRMVKALSDLYGVPFERDRARAMVIALMGGTMPTGLAVATVSALVYLVPGSSFIGLAVSSVAAVACTRSIGRVFVEHFETAAAAAAASDPR